MGLEVLYLNGAFMPLSEGRVGIEDRGFEMGDGVYEVVKVMNGRIVWLADHLERLGRSLAAIDLAKALAGHQLDSVLPELVVRAQLGHGSVYVQVTRGAAPREFEFPAEPRPTVLAYAREQSGPQVHRIMAGTVLHPVEDPRWARCDIKSTNLLPAVLAKEEARRAGAHEALFIAPDGLVREGGSSSVFAYVDGVLRTHPLNNRILAGVTRAHLVEMARIAGYVVEERAFTLAEVTSQADAVCEVFTASTTKDVMPVVQIGAETIGTGRPGPVTLSLLDIMRREQALLVGLEPPARLAPAAFAPPAASS